MDIKALFPAVLSEQGLLDGGAKRIEGITSYSLKIGKNVGIYEPVLNKTKEDPEKSKKYTLRSILDSEGKRIPLD